MLLPLDSVSIARRCGHRNAWPVLPDARTWWPSRSMTQADYQRIDSHLRKHERCSDDTICLSLVSAGMLGLDSDEPLANVDERCAFFDLNDVRNRLHGHVPLTILDNIGADF